MINLLILVGLTLIMLIVYGQIKKSKGDVRVRRTENDREMQKTNPGDDCPGCSSNLVKKRGRRGYFIGCSNYPKCKFTCDYEYTDEELLRKKLRTYRTITAKREGYIPYTIFTDAEMELLIKQKPQSKSDLLKVKGFGEKKVEKYGEELLNILKEEYQK